MVNTSCIFQYVGAMACIIICLRGAMVAQLTFNQLVAGSSPAGGTFCNAVN